MKPIVNLTDSKLDIPELKILAQASIENVPVPFTVILTKEVFNKKSIPSDVQKQLKVLHDKLSENGNNNILMFTLENNGYTPYLCEKSFENFLETINKIYQDFKGDKDKFFILVQKNITPESSGILFTHDIETNDPNGCVIEALYGEGGIMNYELKDTDRYKVDKTKEIIADKFVVKQEKMIVPSLNKEALEEIEISPRWQSKQKLDDRHILILMEVAKYLEDSFEKDLEIRWVYEAGKIFVLTIQRRDHLMQFEADMPIIEEKFVEEKFEVEIVDTPQTVEELEENPEEKKENIFAQPKQEEYVPHFLMAESEDTPPSSDLEPVMPPVREPSVEKQSEEIKSFKEKEEEVKEAPTYINKEEILLSGVGMSGDVVKGIATLSAKGMGDILVTNSIENITRKEAIKFAGFIIDDTVHSVPKYLAGKAVVSSVDLATKLIKDGEEIKIDGKSGQVYEIQQVEVELEQKQEKKIEKPKIVKKQQEPEVEQEVKPKLEVVKEVQIPQAPSVKEIPEIKIPERVIKTATKVFIKGTDINEDHENYDGYVTDIEHLKKLTEITRTKTIMVLMSNDIEKDCEVIKKLRAGSNKNIWLILPKARSFAQLEEQRSRITGIRRSSTLKILGYVATPANVMMAENYLEAAIDGIYIDLHQLKSLLKDEVKSEHRHLGTPLTKCLKEISSIMRKSKFLVYADLDGFVATKSIVHSIFELGFSTIISDVKEVTELKSLLSLEEKSKIIKAVRGSSR